MVQYFTHVVISSSYSVCCTLRIQLKSSLYWLKLLSRIKKLKNSQQLANYSYTDCSHMQMYALRRTCNRQLGHFSLGLQVGGPKGLTNSWLTSNTDCSHMCTYTIKRTYNRLDLPCTLEDTGCLCNYVLVIQRILEDPQRPLHLSNISRRLQST